MSDIPVATREPAPRFRRRLLIAPAMTLGLLVAVVMGQPLWVGATAGGIVAGLVAVALERIDRSRQVFPSAVQARTETEADLDRQGDFLLQLVINLLLLAVLLMLLFGIEAAYWLALLATPLWLVAMIIMAIEGRDPVMPPEETGERSA